MENVKFIVYGTCTYIITVTGINKNKQYPFSLMYVGKEL